MAIADVRDLEDRVLRLSAEDLAAFRAWFADFDAAIWDRELETDVAAGRLDRLAEEALRELKEGRTSEL